MARIIPFKFKRPRKIGETVFTDRGTRLVEARKRPKLSPLRIFLLVVLAAMTVWLLSEISFALGYYS